MLTGREPSSYPLRCDFSAGFAPTHGCRPWCGWGRSSALGSRRAGGGGRVESSRRRRRANPWSLALSDTRTRSSSAHVMAPTHPYWRTPNGLFHVKHQELGWDSSSWFNLRLSTTRSNVSGCSLARHQRVLQNLARASAYLRPKRFNTTGSLSRPRRSIRRRRWIRAFHVKQVATHDRQLATLLGHVSVSFPP